MDYFEITDFQTLCSLEIKEGFMESKLIQDFPIWGKGVYLRIKKRRWRHKQTKEIIIRDFSFIPTVQNSLRNYRIF